MYKGNIIEEEDLIDIDVSDSSLDEETDDLFSVDLFVQELRYSLSLTSVDELTPDYKKQTTIIKSDKNDLIQLHTEETRVLKPFALFAVEYVNKYLVTDLSFRKQIEQWGQSLDIKEMTAIPTHVRSLLRIKNLTLGPFLRLIVTNLFQERIEEYRQLLPIHIPTEEKDEILERLICSEFEDEMAWSTTLNRFLETGFISKHGMSSLGSNIPTFQEKVKLCHEEELVYSATSTSNTNFMPPKIIFNISNMKRFNGHYLKPNFKRYIRDEICILDPMVKPKMRAKLNRYINGKLSKIPRFSKHDFEHNINLNHPIIPHLLNLRNPRFTRHCAGELNSSLLFNIEQHQTHEQDWVEMQKLKYPIEEHQTRQPHPYFRAPKEHFRFRRSSASLGSFYFGYSQLNFDSNEYGLWVFESIHFHRIETYMYGQELSRCKKMKSSNGWPCIVYDLSILNLPFKVNGKDFIQMWLLGKRDETEDGFVYLPGLEEQYTAMVMENKTLDEYIQSYLTEKLTEEETLMNFKAVLNFNI